MLKLASCLLSIIPFVALADTKRDPNNFGSRTSAEQCQMADWRAVGRYDGRRGMPQPQQFVVIARTCEGHGVSPHQDEYFRGYYESHERLKR